MTSELLERSAVLVKQRFFCISNEKRSLAKIQQPPPPAVHTPPPNPAPDNPGTHPGKRRQTGQTLAIPRERGHSTSLRSLLPRDGCGVAYGDSRCWSLGNTRDSLRSSLWPPRERCDSPYGLSRWRSRGNNTASRMLSRSSIVMRRRSAPNPQPAWGGMPYLNIFV